MDKTITILCLNHISFICTYIINGSWVIAFIRLYWTKSRVTGVYVIRTTSIMTVPKHYIALRSKSIWWWNIIWNRLKTAMITVSDIGSSLLFGVDRWKRARPLCIREWWKYHTWTWYKYSMGLYEQNTGSMFSVVCSAKTWCHYLYFVLKGHPSSRFTNIIPKECRNYVYNCKYKQVLGRLYDNRNVVHSHVCRVHFGHFTPLTSVNFYTTLRTDVTVLLVFVRQG